MPDPITRPRLHPLLGTAAVAVIVTCVVGVYAMLRPTAQAPTVAPVATSASASTAVSSAPIASVPVAASAVSPAEPASDVLVSAPVPATPVVASSPPVVPKPHPRPHVVHHRPAPVVRQAPEDPALYDNLPGYSAGVQPCASCGTVLSIQAIDVSQPTTGLGGLGGAAAGGLAGNQFGRGRGRTAMTVLGALGGALAGNAVEQGMNRRVVYRMVVGFEDGTRRTFTQDQPFPFGEGEGVRMVNGMLYQR